VNIDRIMEAGGGAANISRQELLADLEGELAIYRTGVMLRKAPGDREKAVEGIETALERGRALLSDYIKRYGMAHLKPQVAALNRMLGEIRKEDNHGLNKVVGLKQRVKLSAVERLVLGLLKIYERHYGRAGGYTDNKYTDSTTGPFIDFADTVLQEAGIHYDRSSISRTMREGQRSLTDEAAPVS
jgi:hypothetical protein